MKLVALTEEAYAKIIEAGIKPEMVCETDTPVTKIINENDFLAMKCWTREDIAGCLKEKGYLPTTKNIDKVIDIGMIKYLEDCTDEDWEIINTSINEITADIKTIKDLVYDDEELTEMVLEGEYQPRYFIKPKSSTDIGGALELTLNRMLENGLEDRISIDMGVIMEDDIPEEEIDNYISIDLGYYLPPILTIS